MGPTRDLIPNVLDGQPPGTNRPGLGVAWDGLDDMPVARSLVQMVIPFQV
jgi:hypothetical protein